MADAALSGAGTLASVAAPIHQGQTDYAAGNYNAQVAEQNAIQSEQQAAEEERRFRIQSKKQLGDMRASYGASGVSMEGSPSDILGESAATAELDALTIKHQGAVKAQAYKQEAVLQRFYAKQGRLAGYLGAAGVVASKAAQASKASAGGGGGGGGTG